METMKPMHLARLALLAILCCMAMRDSVSELARGLEAKVFHCAPGQLPDDDGSQMPVPLEGEEGELSFFKVKFEGCAWTSIVLPGALQIDSNREQAENVGSFFFCSRELFNSLHRLRI
jgi:hypothetical protein